MDAKIDLTKIGRLKTVTYEKDGVTYTVEGKRRDVIGSISGQRC